MKKYKKDYIKVLDTRYKSKADDGLHETNLSLVEAFDLDLNDLVYAVLIEHTFNDGINIYDQGHDGKIFASLEEAKNYFNKKAKGMYLSKEDELLHLLKIISPKK